VETQKDEEVTSVLLHEQRIFKPREEVIRDAIVKDWEAELKAGEDLEKYWGEKALQFEWFARWTKVLDDSNKPFYKWFIEQWSELNLLIYVATNRIFFFSEVVKNF